MIDSFVNNSGVWVLIGIVAGVIIELSVHYFIGKYQRKRDKENFKFEIKLNIKKLDRWIGYVEKMRNDLSTDSIHNFFEYFDFSKTIFIVANNLSQSGDLYSILKDEQIEKLQQNISFLSFNYENLVNDMIKNQKQEAASSKEAAQNVLMQSLSRPYEKVKEEIVMFINYLERQLRMSKENFEDILNHI